MGYDWRVSYQIEEALKPAFLFLIFGNMGTYMGEIDGAIDGWRFMWWTICRGGERFVGVRKMSVNLEIKAWISSIRQSG